jgi:acetyl-CoA/propionyl-CoA carboxylase, biotin carboxylase, biotin carboxyl carrier protein
VNATRVFESVLVANRGEIAVRVIRTLRSMGIRSVAIYSDADAGALHVRLADTAVRIGPAPARESYLDIDRVIGAALATGVQAIHPGYGFLSENPALARACEANGIAFVGPPVAAIEAMGDKIAAKAMVAAAGVRVVPGSSGVGLDDDALAAAAELVGFPVLIKPSAGGGGKGMRLVESPDNLATAIESARREARSSFGDDTLLIERWIQNPRHVEIQVLADTHGNVVHLGERECSLQRRHQKIIEEAPSPLLTPDQRKAMGAQAVEAARSCNYTGAGTVEFIVSADRPGEFFFMEMNTRLQVEHPVTELVFGIDLVELQLRVAAGELLPFNQADLVGRGHAVEARVYAEDPARGFLPTGGTVLRVIEPSGEGVRVDSGIADGVVVGSDYDPMLAKVIAWGIDRGQALRCLDKALATTVVLGVTTNIGFLRHLIAVPEVLAGQLDTGLVERRLDDLIRQPDGLDIAIVAAAVLPLSQAAGATDPWRQLVGWRHSRLSATRVELAIPGHDHDVLLVRSDGDAWIVARSDRADLRCAIVDRADGAIDFTIDGIPSTLVALRRGRTTWVSVGGSSWPITEVEQRGAGAATANVVGDGVVRSPMPGTVIGVSVIVNAEVAKGESVAVVEAMKMEHTLTAPFDGVVSAIHVAVGSSVALDQPVVTITALVDQARVDQAGDPS